ncbi:GNAT family N-acetyltransferase [Duganella sp. S19_KUP01_CR8]|uniref:GNAT family N-acetyltransferase n=1 Tax=Duganella sp. S19_KUP01_CR8 TaxID=3025502 RepID=UPI002FCD70E5
MKLSTTSGEFNVAPTATAWAKGWTLTRNKASPVSQAYGCKIDLGLPECLERHVVVSDDEGMLVELTSKLQTPGTWLKVCAHPEKVSPLLHKNWQVQAPEYLMAVALKDAVAGTHGGYLLSLSTSGAVTEAELRDVDGQLAAKGKVAHCDGVATFDQIVTEPMHQRKGLGRVIMATLVNAAIAHEARTGVLVATEQGRALYQAIGWAMVSPVTAAVIV